MVRTLRTNLRGHGFQVETAETAGDALASYERRQPDLIVLDLNLPDGDGFEVVRRIRERSGTPIIVLSARGGETDKVNALDLGADDYITKPFGIDELLARIRVALRHVARPGTGAEPRIASGDLVVDLERREVTVSGRTIHLTPTEYDLLKVLRADRLAPPRVPSGGGPLRSDGRRDTSTGPDRRVLAGIRHALFGRPLTTEAEGSERLSVATGYAILASDNISSSAYATEEAMRVLALAGVAALSLTMPIALAIVGVLAVVVLSQLQVIKAYPNGGGSYVVTSDNLGRVPGLVAASSLLIDYVLTVAVSTAAGVAAISSFAPALHDMRVPLGLAFIALLAIGNLRGIREAGMIFAIPTYVYVLSLAGLIAYGLFRVVSGDVPAAAIPPDPVPAAGVTALSVRSGRERGSEHEAARNEECVEDPHLHGPDVRHDLSRPHVPRSSHRGRAGSTRTRDAE